MESPDIPVDVVVAVRHLKYTEYFGQRSYKNIEGLGLYLPTETRWTVSYPHIHRRNGVKKEKSTGGGSAAVYECSRAPGPNSSMEAGWGLPRRGRTT